MCCDRCGGGGRTSPCPTVRPHPRPQREGAQRPGPERPGGRPGAGNVSTSVAVILFAGVVLYAVFGGADFGAGFWDLTAGGAGHGRAPRALVDESIGPVWEANHV